MLKIVFLSPILSMFFLFFNSTLFGQVIRMDATNNGSTFNITCPGTGVRFADEGSGSSHYSDNSDYTVTLCAEAGKLLKFDFGCGSNLTNERIDPTDTLYIYDGSSTSDPLIYAVTGTNSNGDKIPYFGESSQAEFVSPSQCITFRFVSDASENTDGWDACVRCVDPVDCGGNEPASDMFGGAPMICNLDGYCGTTSGTFGADYPYNLNKSGGNCPSGQNFLGTIENNSWLKFEATSTTAVFDFDVAVGGSCVNGIQAAILAFDGSSLTRMSDCFLSDGSHAGNFQVTGTGLTVGEEYYLMVDGNQGDICDYSITANNGVATVDAGPDQIVCAGDPVNLSASGVSGESYVWNSLDGVVVNDAGQNQTYNPLVATTYVVESIGECNDSRDTVNVSMCSPLPTVWGNFEAQEIQSNEVSLIWQTYSEINADRIEILRTNEIGSWFKIGEVKAKGSQSDTYNYSFNDRNPLEGTNYYRLVFIDFDGSRALSEVRSVRFSNGVNFSFVPNPTSGKANMTFSTVKELENAELSFKIYSQLGQDVTGLITTYRENDTTLKLDLERLKAGHYLVSVQNRMIRIFKQ